MEPDQIQPSPPSQKPSFGDKLKKYLGPVGVALVVFFKFLVKLKFLLLLLKTGGTMTISMWAYALTWGWKYAVGFVLLILIMSLPRLFFCSAPKLTRNRAILSSRRRNG